MTKNCIICGSLMVKKPSDSKSYWAVKKMCSHKCNAIYRTGKSLPSRPLTQDIKDKISATKKGNCGGNKHPMWKGGDLTLKCLECGDSFTTKRNGKQTNSYCSKKCSEIGRAQSISRGKKGKPNPNSTARKGWKMSEESRKKISDSQKGVIRKPKTQKNCPQCSTVFYVSKNSINQVCCSTSCANKHKDKGKTSEAFRFRTSNGYKQWRTDVFKRDKYTCQDCGQRGRKLNADHIKPFSLFPELRLDIDNGKTLCEDCHRKTPTFGSRIRKKAA